jgi:nucleoside-diphosphate-sugar epimerase
MPTGPMRIVFTGGSGKAGRHVIPALLARGHQVLNLDRIDFPDPSAGVFTLKTDLTDSGQVFNALTTHFNFAGYEGPDVPGPPDAVIHFAAYARNMLVPVRTTPKQTPAQEAPTKQVTAR